MKSITWAVMVVFLCTGLFVFAGESTKTGVLLDANCGEKAAPNAEKVAQHKKSCSLSENCLASGLGLVADGKFYKFDAAGSEKAAEIMKASSKESNVTVTVKGNFSGDVVQVASIEESM